MRGGGRRRGRRPGPGAPPVGGRAGWGPRPGGGRGRRGESAA
uniref:Uncharacterized protein n=1 Tax=Arundo donax TaxID=35708 RepID=A0A0A9HC15_ARUDO